MQVSHPRVPQSHLCSTSPIHRIHLKALGRKAQPRRARILEHDKLRLEEDITEDGNADAGVGLDTAEASYISQH